MTIVRATHRPLGARRLAALAWRVALCTGILASAVVLTIKVLPNAFMFDFNRDLYGAGRAILGGHDPYHPGYLAGLAAIKRAGGATPTGFALPVYPAPMLLAAVPFSLLPDTLACLLFAVLMVAAMVCGLRLLGVRDWRCIALALASWPSLYGLAIGNLGPALVLGIAVAWCFRAKLLTPAIAIASVVVAKVFPWTLLIWLLVTRRFRTLGLVLLIGTAGVLGAWAVIGFAGMSEYPRMLSNLSFVERGAGVSLTAALLGAGVPGAVAEMVALGAAALLLFAAYRFAQRPNGDAKALGLTVIAALTASPIVWPHYLVLLFVPIALTSPTLSPVWFIPLLTALLPTPNPHSLVEMLFWIAVEAAVVVHVCLSPMARNATVGSLRGSRRRLRSVSDRVLPGTP
jgi:hypothetical protein